LDVEATTNPARINSLNSGIQELDSQKNVLLPIVSTLGTLLTHLRDLC